MSLLDPRLILCVALSINARSVSDWSVRAHDHLMPFTQASYDGGTLLMVEVGLYISNSFWPKVKKTMHGLTGAEWICGAKSDLIRSNMIKQYNRNSCSWDLNCQHVRVSWAWDINHKVVSFQSDPTIAKLMAHKLTTTKDSSMPIPNSAQWKFRFSPKEESCHELNFQSVFVHGFAGLYLCDADF